jgi:hypothetical protein
MIFDKDLRSRGAQVGRRTVVAADLKLRRGDGPIPLNFRCEGTGRGERGIVGFEARQRHGPKNSSFADEDQVATCITNTRNSTLASGSG